MLKLDTPDPRPGNRPAEPTPEQLDLIRKRRRRNLRIWSAACSTGQEAYSIAMVVAEASVDHALDVEILGTDLSEKALAQARAGRFSLLQVERGLSGERRVAHFREAAGGWCASARLCEMVRFERMNLLHPQSELGQFDIIFCRNLASYFDLDHRRQLFDEVGDHLASEGVLVIGSTETMVGITDQFSSQRAHDSSYYIHG